MEIHGLLKLVLHCTSVEHYRTNGMSFENTQVRDKFINNHDKTVDGEWFNGKTAAFKVGNYGIGGFVMVYSLMVKY